MTNEELVQKLREQGTLGRGYGVNRQAKPITPAHPDYRYATAPAPVIVSPATAAKYSKPAVAQEVLHKFPRAITEIARVSAYGAAKHQVPLSSTSFLDVPGANMVYADAEARHMLAEQIEGPINRADGDLYHKAQKAWNPLADIEVFLRSREFEEKSK